MNTIPNRSKGRLTEVQYFPFPSCYFNLQVILDNVPGQDHGLSRKRDVELTAPGVSILSTIPGGGHAYYSGTSMASPHVAGAAALVLAANPTLTNVEIRSILQHTAENLGLKQKHEGYGLVRVDLAVKSASGVTPEPDPDPDPEPGTSITVSSVDYSLSKNLKHIYVSVQLDPAVVGASVSIAVYLNGGSSPYST
ncbi:S8 family serine peptidase [Mesotoga sp. B105.6.4]|uniref:S8 family serine peptidase n=1 Tax=Mesotoga sp. B105.6.4 TaxID=1582224 RepID=UPI000CCC0935|nr:S8 family serine peptidase [Mesotoga sp. B105.6.4]PNS40932.1 hypothetical protein RJ60_05890 [Mesotoga sp. B105.6.4]